MTPNAESRSIPALLLSYFLLLDIVRLQLIARQAHQAVALGLCTAVVCAPLYPPCCSRLGHMFFISVSAAKRRCLPKHLPHQ
jgi:uncharacterized PurR-regulated membrane protein YhhQ (DUF165 family)